MFPLYVFLLVFVSFLYVYTLTFVSFLITFCVLIFISSLCCLCFPFALYLSFSFCRLSSLPIFPFAFFLHIFPLKSVFPLKTFFCQLCFFSFINSLFSSLYTFPSSFVFSLCIFTISPLYRFDSSSAFPLQASSVAPSLYPSSTFAPSLFIFALCHPNFPDE